ncbi:MAG: ABC transporter permease [Myxococcota bacterium]
MLIARMMSSAHWRELVLILTWREVVARYKRSVLGLGWALAEPLSLGLVYFVVFQRFARIPVDNYPFFLLAGLLPWTFLQGSVAHCAGVMVENSPVIKKVAFPREILIFSKLGSQAVNFLLSLALVVATGLLTGRTSLGLHTLWMLPATLLLLTLTGALGAAAAVLSPYARDVPHLLQFAFRLGLYATPIVYTSAMVPEDWRWLLQVNPMTCVVELFHVAVLGTSPDMGVELVGVSALMLVVASAAGWWAFTRLEPRIAEVV